VLAEPACEGVTVLDFKQARLVHNDLGGLKGSGQPTMEFDSIGHSADGSPIKLIVTNITEYTPPPGLDNGPGSRPLAALRVAAGTGACWSFNFVDSTTRAAVKLDNVVMSFVDLDRPAGGTGESCSEVLTACNMDGYFTSPDTEIQQSAMSSCVDFTPRSSVTGGAVDSPEDPHSLTPEQASHAVVLQHRNTSEFEACFETAGSCTNPGDILIGGLSSIDGCTEWERGGAGGAAGAYFTQACAGTCELNGQQETCVELVRQVQARGVDGRSDSMPADTDSMPIGRVACAAAWALVLDDCPSCSACTRASACARSSSLGPAGGGVGFEELPATAPVLDVGRAAPRWHGPFPATILAMLCASLASAVVLSGHRCGLHVVPPRGYRQSLVEEAGGAMPAAGVSEQQQRHPPY